MFDGFLVHDANQKRLTLRWSRYIPGLVRVPIFSQSTDTGFVVSYKEKTREYVLHCFAPESGEAIWEANLINGGYGAPALGQRTVAVPTKFIDVTGIDTKTGAVRWVWAGHARVRSPIAHDHDTFLFSCGPSLIQLDEGGEPVGRIDEPGHFFFGLPHRTHNMIVSQATWTNASGRSQIGLLAYELDGKLLWKADLGEGQIISSDTSGFAQLGTDIWCCGSHRIFAVDATTGAILWAHPTKGIVGRQMPVEHRGRLYVPSVCGEVLCLDSESGEPIWTFRGRSIVNTPVSVLGDLVAVSVDGQIHLLEAATGRPFDQIPTGHSPYSAITFWHDRAFIGGGDPPYHGRLYCFDLTERERQHEFVCTAKTVGALDGRESFVLQAEISNVTDEIIGAHLNASVLTEEITNGANRELMPTERDGNRFIFEVPLRSSAVAGLYCLDITLKLATCRMISRTALVQIERAAPIPNRFLLHEITPMAQTDPLHSGAAAIQMLKAYYGQPVPDQVDLREMVDYIRARSGYEPFNIWRIVARRALSTSACNIRELPEFGQQSLPINADGVE